MDRTTSPADEDTALMLRVKAGDRRAFGTLFDRHAASVVRFARRYVGDAARAEEITQDVFMRLFQAAPRYEPSARFQTFLFRIASNACLNERRRGVYRSPHTSTEAEGAPVLVDGSSSGPEQQAEGRELERQLQGALERLSERERLAFSLCRFEGMAYRDIAEALETTEAAIKSLLHRATLAVARHLAEAQSPAVAVEGSAA